MISVNRYTVEHQERSHVMVIVGLLELIVVTLMLLNWPWINLRAHVVHIILFDCVLMMRTGEELESHNVLLHLKHSMSHVFVDVIQVMLTAITLHWMAVK